MPTWKRSKNVPFQFGQGHDVQRQPLSYSRCVWCVLVFAEPKAPPKYTFRFVRVAHQGNWIAWQVMHAMWHVARRITMLHRSPPKCYHLVSAARNLKCREVLSAWWPFPLSSVKHSSFLTIFGYLGYVLSSSLPFCKWRSATQDPNYPRACPTASCSLMAQCLCCWLVLNRILLIFFSCWFPHPWTQRNVGMPTNLDLMLGPACCCIIVSWHVRMLHHHHLNFQQHPPCFHFWSMHWQLNQRDGST